MKIIVNDKIHKYRYKQRIINILSDVITFLIDGFVCSFNYLSVQLLFFKYDYNSLVIPVYMNFVIYNYFHVESKLEIQSCAD